MAPAFNFSLPAGTPQAEVGVFGGSGFYHLMEDAETVAVETPYGPPSDHITIGSIGGKRVAFLPRHGRNHVLPPHKINYRANVWAFKSLGIRWVISPCAAGSLQKHIEPGHFVVCDQYVDRTSGRADTFFDGPVTTHVSAADPFCPTLRELAIQSAKDCGITVHSTGTVVVIQGPRFSTRSESRWFKDQGWEVINMTQYPEVHLVKELEMSVVNISLITDYDTGVEGIPPVSHESVVEVFTENNEKLRRLLFTLIEKIPANQPAPFEQALAGARM
ncbi:MAG: S-methyl-5'-thioadenosine phosphorylase [Candidatus Melainabacteria bacterium]|nr:S-methyl-5'-thioadenosine phosphorylase [Candidatus Melainabacteria bacterium]